VSRSPTPTTGGSTSSEPASTRLATSRDISTLTTAETSSSRPAPPGFDMGRSRHGAQLAVDQPSSDTGVRFPPGPPRRRSSAGQSSCLSSRRSRVQVPSVAPRRRGRMEKAPVYETGECRFDPCRRRSARRSSVDESTALRRRGSHVRVVPARRPTRRTSQAGGATAGTPRSNGFTDRKPRGRRPTARMRACHARDAGSIPADHTTPTTTRRG
jgi:hypothetical protein